MLPNGATPLVFAPPAVCNAGRPPSPPDTLQAFDWCAFVAEPDERWKEPRRRHDCTRADTPEQKKACVASDVFELVGVAYADVVPATQRLTRASLCEGEEALLLFRVEGPEGTHLVLQARCPSRFPPDALRAGLNGEFSLPVGVEAPSWFVRDTQLGATYSRSGRPCRKDWAPDRSAVARYGGIDREECQSR